MSWKLWGRHNIKVVLVLVSVSSLDCVSSFSMVEEDVAVAVAIDMVGAAVLGALLVLVLVLVMVETTMLSLVVLLVMISILASGCCILNAVKTIFTGTLPH